VKITITEIAKLANVSKSSVSLVLNNKPGVSAVTRAKVLAIIKKYRYHPNQVAQSLAGGETKSIGLVIKEIDNPYFARITQGVYDACSEKGYSVLLGSSEQSIERESEIIKTMVRKRVDGLIISPLQGERPDYSYLGDLMKDAYPFVVLGSVTNFSTNVVDIDNHRAAHEAVSYLIRRGHTNVMHMAGPLIHGHAQQRLEGYKQALIDRNLPVRKENVLYVQPSVADGYQAGKEFFSKGGELPSAVFCFNDLVAIGLINALTELGLDVPGRISVIGFDDIQIGQYVRVPLTTVHVPAHEIGIAAANLLIRHIGGGSSSRTESITLEHKIVERNSVATVNESRHTRATA
jgi:LacI family transcriptional regulator